jgi:hypothetical protein
LQIWDAETAGGGELSKWVIQSNVCCLKNWMNATPRRFDSQNEMRGASLRYEKNPGIFEKFFIPCSIRTYHLWAENRCFVSA